MKIETDRFLLEMEGFAAYVLAMYYTFERAKNKNVRD